MPIYFVANNNSLKEISTYLPLTNQHLQQLSGFGKAKADKYGDEILAMVHGYCDKHHLETNIKLKEATPKRQRKEQTAERADGKIPSAVISMQLFKEGKSIADIAKERVLAASTIESHLTNFVKTGEIKVDAFADETTVKLIGEYLTTNIDKQHAEIRTMLNNAYSFAQIRAVANHLTWLENKNVPQSI